MTNDLMPVRIPTMNRRSCLKLMGALALSSGAALDAVSSAFADEETAGPTLRVGLSGGSTDSLDPGNSNAMHLPYTIKFNEFDSLATLEGDEVVMQLATDFSVNEDATEWTITIRDDATFHDGTPVTADDVLYSLEYIGTSMVGMMSYAYVDFEASTSDGAQTVVLKMLSPQATLVEEALSNLSFVFPAGTTSDDFSHDVGSGPYILESFDADSGSVLVANENYWGGAPAIKRIELFPIADASTRMTALQSGQIDYADGISATSAAVVEEGAEYALLVGGAAHSSALKFCMNASTAPFDDPEVRLAFKQIVDRRTMVDTIFRGYGEIGNDVVGKGLPGYNDEIEQRDQDFDAAAAVFADKGITALDVLTSDQIAGINDSVDMLSQQMSKAGVTLNVTKVDPSTIYTTDVGKIYETQIFACYLINRPYVTTAQLYTGADSAYNFSQWKDETYNDLLNQGVATADEAERTELFNEAQQRIWEDGAEVVWGYAYELSAHVPTLSGVRITQSVPLFHEAVLA